MSEGSNFTNETTHTHIAQLLNKAMAIQQGETHQQLQLLQFAFEEFSRHCRRISFPALICSRATVCADLSTSRRRETSCGCSVAVPAVGGKHNKPWTGLKTSGERTKSQDREELTISWPAGGRNANLEMKTRWK